MKAHIVSYDFGKTKISKSKIHNLHIYGKTDSKTFLVIMESVDTERLNKVRIRDEFGFDETHVNDRTDASGPLEKLA